MPGYTFLLSPTLYAGQTVTTSIEADPGNADPVMVGLYIQTYGADDALAIAVGPDIALAPGTRQDLSWCLPDTGGAPIATIGVELRSTRRADGVVYMDYLNWSGTPDVALMRPPAGGTLWQRAWVNGMDQLEFPGTETYRLLQNQGTGSFIQGSADWVDYQVDVAVTPHLLEAGGIGARVQGLRRYYALLLDRNGTARLVKALNGEMVLAEMDFPWTFGGTYQLSLQVVGTRIRAAIDGVVLFEVEDTGQPLVGGGVSLIATEGRLSAGTVFVHPPNW